MSAAIGSNLRSRMSATLYRRLPRAGPGMLDQPGKAACAAFGRGLDIGRRAFHHQADDFVGVGRIAILERGSGDPLAVDVVRECLCAHRQLKGYFRRLARSRIGLEIGIVAAGTRTSDAAMLFGNRSMLVLYR